MKKLFNKLTDTAEISFSNEKCIVISWSIKNFGFGDYTFFKKEGVWKLDSETCGKEKVKKVLGILIDSLELVD